MVPFSHHLRARHLPALVFLLCLFLCSCRQEGLSFPSSNGNLYLAVDCQIINAEGQLVRMYPYEQCTFLDDGRMLVETGNAHLSYLDTDGRLIWTLKVGSHHMFSLSNDKKVIYLIGSEDHKIGSVIYRLDVLYRISWDGEILSKWRVRENLAKLRELMNVRPEDYSPVNPQKWFKTNTKGTRELTHGNSIQVIPPNDLEKTLPAWAAGNVMVNLNATNSHWAENNRLLIFDPSLEKILWVSKRIGYVHDVHVLPSGNILLFNNNFSFEPRKSAIEEIDPRDESVKVAISGDAALSFSADLLGCAQKLNPEEYLLAFTDREKGQPQRCEVHIVNPKGKSLWSYKNPYIDSDNVKCPSVQRARVLDLSGFLRKSTH